MERTNVTVITDVLGFRVKEVMWHSRPVLFSIKRSIEKRLEEPVKSTNVNGDRRVEDDLSCRWPCVV